MPYESLSKKRVSLELPLVVKNFNNVLLRLFDNQEDNLGYFNSVSPVISNFNISKLKDNANIILEIGTNKNSEKNAVIYERENRKSLLLNGSGFWKWHFALQGDPKYKAGYEKFITNLIRWATNKNKFKPVVLEVNKKSVFPGQQLLLNGFLYDAQNNPIKDGRLIVEAIWNEQQFTIITESDSTGKYAASYTPFNEGRYILTAKGFDNNGEIGFDQKLIDVLPYNREFIHTTQDSSFLKMIARQSGGSYYDSNNLEELFSDIDLTPLKNRISDEVDLRFKAWLLYLIIGLIVTEWAVRKSKNLV